MFNQILILLDGSSLAECALPHAASLAQAFEASVTVLRAIEAPQTDGHIESLSGAGFEWGTLMVTTGA
jgi:nucleotide-binding universal stress UspA family protein